EIFRGSLLFRPGSRENYSNSGYTVLAAIIEAVSGQSYVDYIRENLLIPAGMDSTGFWGEPFAPMASSENTFLGCGTTKDWEYSWVIVGNGGMVSTVSDLQKWIESLRDNTQFDDVTREKYGYKAMFENNYGTAGGSNQHNFNATIEYSAQTATLVVAVSNGAKLSAESIGRSVLRTAVLPIRH
ncbi:MAG: serine hydrolase domain-containing protein, partial [Pseudohongiellaceae bacterium]